MSGGPRAVAAVVTHRRPAELRRLLASLGSCAIPPLHVAIADHCPDGQSRVLAAEAGLPVSVLENLANPGPGAGWTRAAEAALRAVPDAEAIWFLDDDVVMPPTAPAVLGEMLEAGGLAAPLLEDRDGLLWAFPEPRSVEARRLIRKARTPADAARLLGEGPHELCWCTGACVLVAADFYRRIGPHREDFFMLGEDLEFSMRAAAAGRAVFSCAVSVPHLPPAGGEGTGRAKFCCLLQNLSYLAFRSGHVTHMRSYLPGNFRRFFRTYGAGAAGDAWRCFVAGAVFGEPAGRARGERIRRRVARAEAGV